MIKKIFNNFLIQIHNDFSTAVSFKIKSIFFLSWPFLIIYYLLIGLLMGFNSGVIVLFISLLVATRVPFIQISIAFFISALVLYLFGSTVDANHQMSYMFVFLFLSITLQFFSNIFYRNDKA